MEHDNKKLIYFTIFLFLDIYLLILFDRLSYGLPAKFSISFIFAILLLAPTMISVKWAYNKINDSLSKWKIFIKIILISIIPAFISGVIFWIIKLRGISGEGELGYMYTPIMGIYFIIISIVISSFIFIVIVNNKLSITTKILLIPIIILSILVGILLFNCTYNGCKNAEDLTEKALSQNDPYICNNEKKLMIDFRSNIPPFFKIQKDPYPEDHVKEKCFFDYTSQKRDDIKLCLYVEEHSFESCIYFVVFENENPRPELCEELKKLDWSGPNSNRYSEAYSICYSELASATGKEEYCEKVKQYGNNSKENCYKNVAHLKSIGYY